MTDPNETLADAKRITDKLERKLQLHGAVTDNITDPDDEFWTGCTDECLPDCTVDHKGEQ